MEFDAIGSFLGTFLGAREANQRKKALDADIAAAQNTLGKMDAIAKHNPSVWKDPKYVEMRTGIEEYQAKVDAQELQRKRQEDALPAWVAGMQAQGATPEQIQAGKSQFYEQFGSPDQVGRVQAADIQAPVTAKANKVAAEVAKTKLLGQREDDAVLAAAKLKQDEIDNKISQANLGINQANLGINQAQLGLQKQTLLNAQSQQKLTNEAANEQKIYQRNQDLKLPETTRVKVAGNESLIDNLKKYQQMAIANNFPVTGSVATELDSLRTGIAQQIGYDISGASLTQDMTDDIKKRVFGSDMIMATNKDKNKFNKSINLLIDEYTNKNQRLRGFSGGTYNPPPPARK